MLLTGSRLETAVCCLVTQITLNEAEFVSLVKRYNIHPSVYKLKYSNIITDNLSNDHWVRTAAEPGRRRRCRVTVEKCYSLQFMCARKGETLEKLNLKKSVWTVPFNQNWASCWKVGLELAQNKQRTSKEQSLTV